VNSSNRLPRSGCRVGRIGIVQLHPLSSLPIAICSLRALWAGNNQPPAKEEGIRIEMEIGGKVMQIAEGRWVEPGRSPR
jgi:hypothetical protein